MTGTRSYTGSATISPTMTILNAQAAQNSQSAPSNTVAIAGIVSGAAVVGILGIVAMLLIIRRPPRSPATPLMFHDDIPVVKNPSLAYPPTPEFDSMGRTHPQKNPFAAKGISVKFNPIPVRNTMTSFNLPPPPPPLDI
jgi:hypothetical protein